MNEYDTVLFVTITDFYHHFSCYGMYFKATAQDAEEATTREKNLRNKQSWRGKTSLFFQFLL